MARPTPVLHRDNPDKDPLSGHTKVTRADWLNMARDTLVSDGVAEVKILSLADRLDVSRSSFYWYFKNRADLLDALLAEWETRNTATLLDHCGRAAGNICEALCNFFRCFVDPSLFDSQLDFAVREWSRRDASVRTRIDTADAQRLETVIAMFARHGYDAREAVMRARMLYYMQLGYHALDVHEPMPVRMELMADYLRGFSGQEPDPDLVREFQDYALSLEFT